MDYISVNIGADSLSKDKHTHKHADVTESPNYAADYSQYS